MRHLFSRNLNLLQLPALDLFVLNDQIERLLMLLETYVVLYSLEYLSPRASANLWMTLTVSSNSKELMSIALWLRTRHVFKVVAPLAHE